MLCYDEIWERRIEKNNCKVCISIATSIVWDLGMYTASQGVCVISATLRRIAHMSGSRGHAQIPSVHEAVFAENALSFTELKKTLMENPGCFVSF